MKRLRTKWEDIFGSNSRGISFKIRSRFSYFSERYKLRRLGHIFIIMLIVWIIGANLIYLSEQFYHQDRIEWDNESFRYYAPSYWSVIVYLTSGIEDYVPDSPVSKTIGLLVLISGITLVGVFTANLAAILINIFRQQDFIKEKPHHIQFKNHFIICGNSSELKGILQQLNYYSYMTDIPVLVISPDAESISVSDRQLFKNVWGITGDPTDEQVLERANIQEAKSIIILANDRQGEKGQIVDARSIIASLKISTINSELHTIVELLNSENKVHMLRARAKEIVDVSEYDMRLIAQSALTHGITHFYYELLEVSPDSNELYCMSIPKSMIGRSYMEVRQKIMASNDFELIVIGFLVYETVNLSPEIGDIAQRLSIKKPNHIINPPKNGAKYNQNYLLQDEDELIVIAYSQPNLNNMDIEENMK